jgi:hypothetical protein
METEVLTTVYLKGGSTVQVPLSVLDGFLTDYRGLIESRKFKAKRPPFRPS